MALNSFRRQFIAQALGECAPSCELRRVVSCELGPRRDSLQCKVQRESKSSLVVRSAKCKSSLLVLCFSFAQTPKSCPSGAQEKHTMQAEGQS